MSRVPLLAVTLALFAAPGVAHATHDGGTSWSVVRLAEDGRTLVATCDMQGEDTTVLRVIDARGRATDASIPAPAGAPWCDHNGRLEQWLAAHPPALAPIEALGFTTVPHHGARSPTGTRHVIVFPRHLGAELRLLDAGRVTRRASIRSGAGYGPITVESRVVWDPQERAVLIVGAKSAGVSPPMMTWKPLLIRWKLDRAVTTDADVADAWVSLARDQLRRCTAKVAPACQAASDGFARALDLVPDHAAARRGMARVDRIMGR